MGSVVVKILFGHSLPPFRSLKNVATGHFDCFKTIITFYKVHFKYNRIFLTDELVQKCSILYGKGDDRMDVNFVRERITQLRLQKDVSEYKMSYDLGHSRGYINNISSGKTLPSMTEFFAICDYFGISPVEFFDTTTANPKLSRSVLEALEQLDEDDLELTLTNVKRLLRK